MRAFSQLLDDLVYTRSRNTKLKLIGDYLKETPDPDRGYGLAALTGTLDIPAVKGAAVRAMAEERVDPVLLYMSRDYVGDMAETVALLWPTSATGVPEADDATISITEAIERLRFATRLDAPNTLASMLDHLDAKGRFALLKLATGALRVGISARLAKQALAQAFGLDVDSVEEVWHGLRHHSPSFSIGRKVARRAADCARYSRLPAVHARSPAREDPDLARGLCRRVEMGRDPSPAGSCRRADPLYSRTGDDISHSFPDVADAFRTRACSTESSWFEGQTKALGKGMAGPRQASTRFSNGSGERPSVRRCLALTPRSFASTTYSSRAKSTCATLRGRAAESDSSASRASSTPNASTSRS